ncbi:MAG: hypothetical protein KF785_00685 [Gemmatimonadales bacterium]|nr:hypothetical protein [Gemmatimonadales bacterium]
MSTLLLNVSLFFGAFMSVQLALAWAEAASYPLGGDKSSLAGFGGVIVLMMIRWLALAGPLIAGAGRGNFAWLPGGRTGQVLTVLTLHIVLGVISLQTFNWITAAIQADNPGPLKLAWLPGLVLPIVVIAVAFWSINRDGLTRRPWIGAVVAVLLIAGHWYGWREGYRRPSPPAQTNAPPD